MLKRPQRYGLSCIWHEFSDEDGKGIGSRSPREIAGVIISQEINADAIKPAEDSIYSRFDDGVFTRYEQSLS